ncbi:hypothetical protein CEP54_012910 [Fusarium duplospermum]|uniref:Uncharacterized protein n=1 Tax=Fusarium duplospermum TaxID=1325734 RepID=A0A428P621_9HYPO|nr:hypothetical protein CEP54_012910 [Fusarium duplospermum]
MPDYSCYITIVNKLNCSLTFLNDGADHGYWEVDPPSTIEANSTSKEFQLKDRWGPNGTDGWVRYRVDLADATSDSGKPVIRVHFADPTGNNDNEFDVSAKVKDRSDVACYLFAFSNTDYPKRDHPLKVTLTIGYNTSLETSSKVASLSVPKPIIRVRNTKDVVNFRNNLVVWRSDNLGEYEDNSDDEQVGSYYPVAVDVTDMSITARDVDVYVNVKDQMLGVPFVLYGGTDAAGTVASSDVSQPLMFYTSGEQRIRVTMSPPWERDDTPWAVAGNVTWRFHVTPTSQDVGINSTRLEFYAINKRLPSFYKNVVGVTLLRRFVVPLRDNSIPWVTHCCNGTFTDFKFKHDSRSGKASYVGTYAGGSFKLASYLSDIKTGTTVNCYDQAAIMQICLGLAPAAINAKYVFMDPFGWIVATNLVGRGQCNNPFFLNSSYNPNQVCENNASNRSRFANHAFVSMDPDNKNKIVDACSKPYTGDVNLDKYIKASIQTVDDTRLYRSQGVSPGTSADADFDVSGVTHLDGTTPGVEHLLDLAAAPGPAGPERRSNAALADLFSPSNPIWAELGWTPSRHTIAASPAGTDAEWILTSSSTDEPATTAVGVTIFLASNGLRSASIALGTHLGTYSHPLVEGFFQPPADARRVRGQLNLESGANEGGSAVVLWVYGNVFVQIAHRRVDANGGDGGVEVLHRLADVLHRCIEEGAKDNAVLLKHNPDEGYFEFFAASAGDETITFSFAHQTTLNSAVRQLQVTIV